LRGVVTTTMNRHSIRKVFDNEDIMVVILGFVGAGAYISSISDKRTNKIYRSLHGTDSSFLTIINSCAEEQRTKWVNIFVENGIDRICLSSMHLVMARQATTNVLRWYLEEFTAYFLFDELSMMVYHALKYGSKANTSATFDHMEENSIMNLKAMPSLVMLYGDMRMVRDHVIRDFTVIDYNISEEVSEWFYEGICKKVSMFDGDLKEYHSNILSSVAEGGHTRLFGKLVFEEGLKHSSPDRLFTCALRSMSLDMVEYVINYWDIDLPPTVLEDTIRHIYLPDCPVYPPGEDMFSPSSIPFYEFPINPGFLPACKFHLDMFHEDHRACLLRATPAQEYHGCIRILEYLRSLGCHWGDSCYWAASYGQVGILRWLRTNGCPWDLPRMRRQFVTNAHIPIDGTTMKNSVEKFIRESDSDDFNH
jgi:hypothetical protein